MRITVLQLRERSIPKVILKCPGDLTEICNYLNDAQERLIIAAGETGWLGSWMRIVFNLTCENPYITLGREIARLESVEICRRPINIRNEFYEFLPDVIGLRTPGDLPKAREPLQALDRGTYPTMVDLTATNQLLRAYITDSRDLGKRMLIKSKDQNGMRIFSTDATLDIDGFYLTFAAPFVTTIFQVSVIENILKDATHGDVLLYQVDATTGAQVLLSRYAPDEITANYRRYYFDQLPRTCCNGSTLIQATGIAKLEPIPVHRDSDFLVIGNVQALTAECQSIRHSRMDDPTAKQLAEIEHQQAIRYLQQEMNHYLGKQSISAVPRPFGSAHLSRHRIGALV